MSGDLSARIQNANQTLLVIDSMQGQYVTSQVLQSNLQQQLEDIQDNTFVAQQKLEDLSVIAETYDREFRDRMANPSPKPFIKTTQDWVLAMFFSTYLMFMVAAVMFVFLRFHLNISLIVLMIFLVFVITFSVYILIMQFA
jgi:hypothetical protein